MAMEIFTVGRGQEGYPERLMPFADMPSRLFVRGALPADEQKTAAIVGARICTAYGKSQAAFFAQVLAANGVAVISGLACGIDAAAFIEQKTQGRLQIGPATLYTILGKFESERYIQEVAVDGRKRTYRITEKGRAAYQAELDRLRCCLMDAESEPGNPEGNL